MEIYAGVIFFNDGPELLSDCLMALKANGIKSICVDGAYSNFPLGKDEIAEHSTDGCLEVANRLGWKVEIAPAGGWSSQVEKRNVYFEKCPSKKHLIVLDADEVLRPIAKDFEVPAGDAFKITECRWANADNCQMIEAIRLYKVYSDLRYIYQHCRVYRTNLHNTKILDSGIVTKAHGYPNTSRDKVPIIFDHYRFKRPAERMKRKREFYGSRGEKQYGYD
jgi:hypothetical protein